MPNLITNTGRAALMGGIKAQSIMLAMGSGGTWDRDDIPIPNPDTEALINEIGRRPVTRAVFVKKDNENGSIVIPTGRLDAEGNMIYEKYAVHERPTRSLYMQFLFGFEDAIGVTVREMGLFIGAEVKPEVPAGKQFYTRNDLQYGGVLYMVENVPPFLRVGNERNIYEFVITI